MPPKKKRTRALPARLRHPIASRVVGQMKKLVGAKVVDLAAVMAGRAAAEAFQQEVPTPAELADFDRSHALYIYAQNQCSVFSEQLTALDEMDAFVDIVGKAEDLYVPDGPPMSPLTTSFFTCWAFFDACVGSGNETIGTTIIAVGEAFGMNSELLRIIGLMEQSRMGLFVCEGSSAGLVKLRELVTGASYQVLSPAGYLGSRDELWYARVLPPPLPGSATHVLFTTPYVVVGPGLDEWEQYFRRALGSTSSGARIDKYAKHMKYGPTRRYWNDFVFEAYVNHQADAIFLTGLPDRPETRPHSEINTSG